LLDLGTRGKYFVALINKLMSPRNELQSINMVEFRGNLIAEKPPRATWRHSPRFNVFGITPYQIAKSAFVGNLLCSSNDSDLVHCADFGTQTSVDAEDFAVDDSCEDEEIENLTA
jgi:hypothetical protein